jgi:hypothetical protein
MQNWQKASFGERVAGIDRTLDRGPDGGWSLTRALGLIVLAVGVLLPGISGAQQSIDRLKTAAGVLSVQSLRRLASKAVRGGMKLGVVVVLGGEERAQ